MQTFFPSRQCLADGYSGPAGPPTGSRPPRPGRIPQNLLRQHKSPFRGRTEFAEDRPGRACRPARDRSHVAESRSRRKFGLVAEPTQVDAAADMWSSAPRDASWPLGHGPANTVRSTVSTINHRPKSLIIISIIKTRNWFPKQADTSNAFWLIFLRIQVPAGY